MSHIQPHLHPQSHETIVRIVKTSSSYKEIPELFILFISRNYYDSARITYSDPLSEPVANS